MADHLGQAEDASSLASRLLSVVGFGADADAVKDLLQAK